MSFDISKLKAKTNSVPVAIKHPTTGEDLVDDQGKVVNVYLFGKASKQYRDFNDSRLKSVLDQQKLSKKIAPPELTVGKLRKDDVDFAVACTDRIDMVYEGNDVNTPEALFELYSDPDFYWLFEQVKAAVENDSNFF